MAESFVLLSALGGDCIEDVERLREDEGLEAILGYPLPACETARQWLDRFHDESLVLGRPLQGAFIPGESTLPRKGQLLWLGLRSLTGR